MSTLRRIIDWLPRDMSLPDDEFRSRHRAMTGMLLLHVPVLFAFGFLGQGLDATSLAIELAFPLVAAVLGALPMIRRRLRTFAVTTGLIYSSVVLLHLSGGAAESALHFLIVLAFVFLYRDWFLFAWAIVLMGFSYKLLELTQGALGDLFPATGTPEMALWALMTAASIASIGLILAWKSAADSQAATIAALETARERDEAAARRDAYGKMYVNLARRSQSLIDRQLAVIDSLEQDVEDPDILAGVFELDHLTTRVRRHGESLLVVADVDLPNRSTEPVQLSDVVRGAQSEIEQYRRVDARIDPSIMVQPAVTRDLVHLLAELLDNATTYSPPSTTVKVHARAGDSGAVVLTVEDHGLGLTPDRLAQANLDLQDTDALDENSIRHLGFRVIARLAEKHGVTVRLTSTNGGGVTAWVEVPATAIASAETGNLAPARLPEAPAQAQPQAPVQPQDQPAAAEAPAPTAPAAPAAPARPAPTSPTPAAPPAAPAPAATTDEAPPDEQQDGAGDLPARTPTTPAPMPAGFSASGRHRRGRRSRTPVAKPHDRQPTSPRSAAPGPPATQERSTTDDTAPPVRPPTVQRPLPTGAVRLPKPKLKPTQPTQPTQPAQASGPQAPAARAAQAPQADAGPQQQPSPSHPEAAVTPGQPGSNGAPPLPRRERGASNRADAQAKDEALDLFSDLEGDSTRGRSSLGDFQRGQESARKEARE